MNTNGESFANASPNGSFHLAPLSSGGFIYNPYWPTVQYPPQGPPPAFITPMSPSSPISPPPSTPTYVSQGIADRQDKLEKYRDKRSKRNFNRPVDAVRRERACARVRDEKGQFSAEKPKTAKKLSINERETMLQALELSQMQSNALKDQLSAVHKELIEMKMQLEAQQQLNQALADENKILWCGTADEVFNTVRPSKYNSTFVDAFKEKVDLSHIELNWTDSPHLEAARVEDSDFEARWEEMSFIAGATP